MEEEALSNITADIAHCGTKGEIDQIYGKTTRKTSHSKKKVRKSRNMPWFDEECKLLRQHFYRQLNSFRESNNTLNRTRMVRAHSDFKHAIRKKIYVHEVQNTENLVQYRPKEYWRLLKETADSRYDNNTMSDEFEVYFKGLSDPDDPFHVADDDIKQCNEQYERDKFQILY